MQKDKITEYIFEQLPYCETESGNFNNWKFQKIRPYIKGDILEIGSGIGTFSKRLLEHFSNNEVVLSDSDEKFIEYLRKKFTGKNCKIEKFDLNSLPDTKSLGYDRFDTIICIDVIEHVKNDQFALNQMFRLLRKGGYLLIITPCNPSLYNKHDEMSGHYRRYTKEELKKKVKKANFSIEKIKYFNYIGMYGWKLSGKDPSRISKLFNLYDKLIPIIKVIDIFMSKINGQSLIAILQKT